MVCSAIDCVNRSATSECGWCNVDGRQVCLFHTVCVHDDALWTPTWYHAFGVLVAAGVVYFVRRTCHRCGDRRSRDSRNATSLLEDTFLVNNSTSEEEEGLTQHDDDTPSSPPSYSATMSQSSSLSVAAAA